MRTDAMTLGLYIFSTFSLTPLFPLFFLCFISRKLDKKKVS